MQPTVDVTIDPWLGEKEIEPVPELPAPPPPPPSACPVVADSDEIFALAASFWVGLVVGGILVYAFSSVEVDG